MKAVSWNVGSYYFLNPAVKYKMTYHGVPIESIYFQPELNGGFVSSQLASFDPDIIFLQEVQSLDDTKHIPALHNYPYMSLLANVHHEHSMLVAAKEPFEARSEKGIHLIKSAGTTFVPLHLNAHRASARLADAALIGELAEGRERIVIIGDTNLWSRGKHCFSPTDRKAYAKLTKYLLDVTANIPSTSLFGLAFDKAFVSADVQITKVRCHHVRSHFMDHYPLVVELTS